MFKYFKNLFFKPTQHPVDQLLSLNDDGLRAFVERDIEHFKNVDKTLYELFLRFRQDILQSIAEFTPEGKFERFKPGVSQDQVEIVVKSSQKMLEKILSIKEAADEAKQNFIDDVNAETEIHKFRQEFDANFGKVSADEASMRKAFPSKEGQKFIDDWMRISKSKSFNQYLETGSKKDLEKHMEENHPEAIRLSKKYGLKIDLDIPDDNGRWPDGTIA